MKISCSRNFHDFKTVFITCFLVLLILLFDRTIFAQKNNLLTEEMRGQIRQSIKKSDYERALYLIQKIEESGPMDAESHFLKGRILQELRQNTEALSSYTLAIHLKPSFVKAYINRALIKGALLDTKGAINDLNSALRIEPNNPAALLNRGVTYASLNRPDLALEDFNRAIKVNNGYADAYRNRGIVLYLSNDKNGACNDWRKSVLLGSSDVQSWTRNFCSDLLQNGGRGQK